MTGATPAHETTLVIRPAPRWAGFGMAEVWRYRELAYFLAWRDLKVRYKQTSLGIAWAVLQPLMYMAVFTIFFGHIAHVPHGKVPYALITLSGSTIWLFFSNSVTQSASSLVSGAALITKVYFPRLLAVMSPIVSAVIDFMLSLLVLLGVAALYGYYPSPLKFWAFIPAALMTILVAMGFGAWLAALNVKYRDVRYVVAFALQLWMFVTPVVYIPTHLRGNLLTLYYLNPMAGPVAIFRWSVVGGALDWRVTFSAATSVVALIAGVLYFRVKEREFADVV